MSEPWGVFQTDVSLHVIPINDLKPHICGHFCWCKPELDDDETSWIHNSMDGREAFECGERLPS